MSCRYLTVQHRIQLIVLHPVHVKSCSIARRPRWCRKDNSQYCLKINERQRLNLEGLMVLRNLGMLTPVSRVHSAPLHVHQAVNRRANSCWPEHLMMAESDVTMTFDQFSDVVEPILQHCVEACLSHCEPSKPAKDLTEQLLGSLQKHLAAHLQGSQAGSAKGVPLPDVDEQLLPLQQQVEDVMQSVAHQRASVPAVISKALEEQLSAMRPACQADTAADCVQDATDQEASMAVDAAAAATDAAAAAAADAARSRELQQALRTALNKLPALRARLEELDARLQRNLEAVDAAHAKAQQPPRTVERVLRTVAAGGSTTREAAAPDDQNT